MNDDIEQIKKDIAEIKEFISKTGTKMNNHIDFVESVYERIKRPFNYIMDTVNGFIPKISNLEVLGQINNIPIEGLD